MAVIGRNLLEAANNITLTPQAPAIT